MQNDLYDDMQRLRDECAAFEAERNGLRTLVAELEQRLVRAMRMENLAREAVAALAPACANTKCNAAYCVLVRRLTAALEDA